MRWPLVLTGFGFVAGGFLPAHGPIHWAKQSTRSSVLTPRFAPRPSGQQHGLVPPCELTLNEQFGRIPGEDIPHFTINSDNTITWDGMGWCVEATGDRSGDVVHVNQCKNDANQLWTLQPSSSRTGENKIQLKNTDKCIEVIDEGIAGNGNRIELRNCGNVKGAWEIAEPIQEHAIVSSYFTRHVLLSSMVLATLFSLLLAARLRRGRAEASSMCAGQGGFPSIVDQGGISLTAPFTSAGSSACCGEMMNSASVTAAEYIKVDDARATPVRDTISSTSIRVCNHPPARSDVSMVIDNLIPAASDDNTGYVFKMGMMIAVGGYLSAGMAAWAAESNWEAIEQQFYENQREALEKRKNEDARRRKLGASITYFGRDDESEKVVQEEKAKLKAKADEGDEISEYFAAKAAAEAAQTGSRTNWDNREQK